MTYEYQSSKLNAIVLSPKFINIVSLTQQMIVELDESPSTGYCWYFSVSNPSVIDLEYKRIFNFNKPNIIGGSQQIIWRFKCLKLGESKIHFSYYKSWNRDHPPLDEYIYIIKVE